MDISRLKADFAAHEKRAHLNITWLTTHASFARRFNHVDQLLFPVSQDEPETQRAFDHHMRWLRAAIVRTLLRSDVFIGFGVIDELIFQAVRAGAGRVVDAVLDGVIANGLHEPGVVVMPLHGFGIAKPLTEIFRGPPASIVLPEAGLALTAQTNNLDATLGFIERARAGLGIAQSFEPQEIRSYAAGDRLSWLERNPLLVMRVRSYSHEPYDSQAWYQLRMRTLQSLVFAASLDTFPEERLGDSRIANNHETLDIRHYLRIATSPRLGRLEAERIPMNVDRIALAEASDLGVTIDQERWEALGKSGRLTELHEAFRQIENGVVAHRMIGRGTSLEAELFARLSGGLDWFRRSFRSGSRKSEQVIALAIAFEMLLTDTYAGGVTERVRRRTETCLTARGYGSLLAEVIALFDARGKYVHSGFGPDGLDLAKARSAWVECVLEIVGRTSGTTLHRPIVGTVLGDLE